MATTPTIIAEKYEVLGRLGQGGQGTVYKVRHLGLDEVRALKIQPDQGADSTETVARFRREGRALARLRHPHIVQVFDLGGGDGEPYYLEMEFVDGPNLAQFLKAKGRPPLLDGLEIARQVASALTFAHSQHYFDAAGVQHRGMIHRDIKPSNILLREQMPINALLADFGLVKLGDAAERTTTGTMMGTYRYSAPEQLGLKRARERVPVDVRADIFAFGLVVYEIIEGAQFHAGLEPQEILARVLFEQESLDPEFTVTVPARLRTLVAQMIQRYPDDRIESMAAVLREIDAIASELRGADETVVQQGPGRAGRGIDEASDLDLEARIRALTEERERRLAVAAQTEAQGARARALEAGAVELATAELEQAMRAQEEASIALRDGSVHQARELYGRTAQLFAEAAQVAAAARARREAAAAQTAAEAARASAEARSAPELAPAVFEEAQALATEATALLDRGQVVEAGRAFADAASAFERARTDAEREVGRRRAAEARAGAETARVGARAAGAEEHASEAWGRAQAAWKTGEACAAQEDYEAAIAAFDDAAAGFAGAGTESLAAQARDAQREASDAVRAARDAGATDEEVAPGARAIEAGETALGAGDATAARRGFVAARDLLQQVADEAARRRRELEERRREEARQSAAVAREHAEEARTTAAAAQAEKEARDEWRKAVVAFGAAERLVRDGRQADAAVEYERARATFAGAEAEAVRVREERQHAAEERARREAEAHAKQEAEAAERQRQLEAERQRKEAADEERRRTAAAREEERARAARAEAEAAQQRRDAAAARERRDDDATVVQPQADNEAEVLPDSEPTEVLGGAADETVIVSMRDIPAPPVRPPADASPDLTVTLVEARKSERRDDRAAVAPARVEPAAVPRMPDGVAGRAAEPSGGQLRNLLVAAAVVLAVGIGAWQWMSRSEAPEEKPAPSEPVAKRTEPPPPAPKVAEPTPSAKSPEPPAAPAPQWKDIAPPTAAPATVKEGEALHFAAALDDPAARYSWRVDGDARGEGTTFDYRPGLDEGGRAHRVDVAALAGGKSFEQSWQVTVSDVNRPPVIARTEPEGAAVAAEPGKQLRFAVTASDPDAAEGDRLTYQWSRDGKPIGSATSESFVLDDTKPGESTTIGITIRDAKGPAAVSHTWVATAKPIEPPPPTGPPRIVAQNPKPGALPGVREGGTVSFSVRAEGSVPSQKLTTVWFQDGREVARGASWKLTAPEVAKDRTTVKVEAEVTNDAGQKAPRVAWTVPVTWAGPTLSDVRPREGKLNVDVGKSTEFAVRASSDGAGGDVRFEWSVNGTRRADERGRSFAYTADEAGSHVVELEAIDERGTRSTQRWTVIAKAGVPETVPPTMPPPAATEEAAPAATGGVTEQEARAWVARLQSAWAQKDPSTLASLGEIKPGQEAAFQKAIGAYKEYRVTISATSIEPDGTAVRVSYDRTDTDETGKKLSHPRKTVRLERGAGGGIVVSRGK